MKRKTGAIITASVLLTAAAFIAMACGDNGDDGGKTTPQPTAEGTATVAPSGPGAITLTSTEITGQSGKVLLVFASEAGGQMLARICAPITSDSFTLDSTVMTDIAAGDDPCAPATAETEFPEGTYTLTAGIYSPGSQTAEAESTQTVSVSGSVTAEIDGAALSQ